MSKKNKNVNKEAFDFNGTWEYAPAPESKDHIQLEKQYQLFIDGKFVKPSSKKYFKSIYEIFCI